MQERSFRKKVNLINDITELLQDEFNAQEIKNIILAFTVLRRLDCALKPYYSKIEETYKNSSGLGHKELDETLKKMAGYHFYNTSGLSFEIIKESGQNYFENFKNFLEGFSDTVGDILQCLDIYDYIKKLEKPGMLGALVNHFCELDLSPDKVSNVEIGYIYEELINRFGGYTVTANGAHFTPPEVSKLMAELLFENRNFGTPIKVYDPACGCGGMLSASEKYLKNSGFCDIELFGQELTPEIYAVGKTELMVKGYAPKNISPDCTLTCDGFKDEKFQYIISNPPFGLSWKHIEKEIKEEHKNKGYSGRFGAGLPRKHDDGSILFLQHIISKMEDDGGRACVVLNGSHLYSDEAGTGINNIRKWIIENDLLETVVSLPARLFYNTEIKTYVWILDSQKLGQRKGKIQLIDASELYEKMEKSVGKKRRKIPYQQIDRIKDAYTEFKDGGLIRIIDNSDLGYTRVAVEKPLKLNFRASHERIEALKEKERFKNLEKKEGKEYQNALLKAIDRMEDRKYKNREEFIKALKYCCDKEGIKLKAPVKKTIIQALSEKDDSADVCIDTRDNPEQDPEQRDYEKVSLNEEVHDYFKREIEPYVRDAWIGKQTVGYEIAFKSFFYKYKNRRNSKEVLNEIRELYNSITGDLEKVLDDE